MDESPGPSAAPTSGTACGGRTSQRVRSKPKEFWRNDRKSGAQALDFPDVLSRRLSAPSARKAIGASKGEPSTADGVSPQSVPRAVSHRRPSSASARLLPYHAATGAGGGQAPETQDPLPKSHASAAKLDGVCGHGKVSPAVAGSRHRQEDNATGRRHQHTGAPGHLLHGGASKGHAVDAQKAAGTDRLGSPERPHRALKSHDGMSPGAARSPRVTRASLAGADRNIFSQARGPETSTKRQTATKAQASPHVVAPARLTSPQSAGPGDAEHIEVAAACILQLPGQLAGTDGAAHAHGAPAAASPLKPRRRDPVLTSTIMVKAQAPDIVDLTGADGGAGLTAAAPSGRSRRAALRRAEEKLVSRSVDAAPRAAAISGMVGGAGHGAPSGLKVESGNLALGPSTASLRLESESYQEAPNDGNVGRHVVTAPLGQQKGVCRPATRASGRAPDQCARGQALQQRDIGGNAVSAAEAAGGGGLTATGVQPRQGAQPPAKQPEALTSDADEEEAARKGKRARRHASAPARAAGAAAQPKQLEGVPAVAADKIQQGHEDGGAVPRGRGRPKSAANRQEQKRQEAAALAKEAAQTAPERAQEGGAAAEAPVRRSCRLAGSTISASHGGGLGPAAAPAEVSMPPPSKSGKKRRRGQSHTHSAAETAAEPVPEALHAVVAGAAERPVSARTRTRKAAPGSAQAGSEVPAVELQAGGGPGDAVGQRHSSAHAACPDGQGRRSSARSDRHAIAPAAGRVDDAAAVAAEGDSPGGASAVGHTFASQAGAAKGAARAGIVQRPGAQPSERLDRRQRPMSPAPSVAQSNAPYPAYQPAATEGWSRLPPPQPGALGAAMHHQPVWNLAKRPPAAAEQARPAVGGCSGATPVASHDGAAALKCLPHEGASRQAGQREEHKQQSGTESPTRHRRVQPPPPPLFAATAAVALPVQTSGDHGKPAVAALSSDITDNEGFRVVRGPVAADANACAAAAAPAPQAAMGPHDSGTDTLVAAPVGQWLGAGPSGQSHNHAQEQGLRQRGGSGGMSAGRPSQGFGQPGLHAGRQVIGIHKDPYEYDEDSLSPDPAELAPEEPSQGAHAAQDQQHEEQFHPVYAAQSLHVQQPSTGIGLGQAGYGDHEAPGYHAGGPGQAQLAQAAEARLARDEAAFRLVPRQAPHMGNAHRHEGAQGAASAAPSDSPVNVAHQSAQRPAEGAPVSRPPASRTQPEARVACTQTEGADVTAEQLNALADAGEAMDAEYQFGRPLEPWRQDDQNPVPLHPDGQGMGQPAHGQGGQRVTAQAAMQANLGIHPHGQQQARGQPSQLAPAAATGAGPLGNGSRSRVQGPHGSQAQPQPPLQQVQARAPAPPAQQRPPQPLIRPAGLPGRVAGGLVLPPAAAEVIRRALGRADQIAQRNKTRQQDIVENEEDGWTLEQANALQTAYFNVEPSHPHFWQEVAQQVKGKSAAECFARVYASGRDRAERAELSKVLRRRPPSQAAAAGPGSGRPLTLAAARKWSQKEHERGRLERLAARMGAAGGESEEEDEADAEDERQEGRGGGRRGGTAAAGRRQLRLAEVEDPEEMRRILDELEQKHHADRFITSFLRKQGGWAKWHRAVRDAQARRQRGPEAQPPAHAAAAAAPAARAASSRPGATAAAARPDEDPLARVIRRMLAKDEREQLREVWREDDRAIAEEEEDDGEDGYNEEEEAVDEGEEAEEEEVRRFLHEEGLLGPDGLPVLP